MKKKKEKKFFVFEIIPSELLALHYLYYADNPCHRQSMRSKTVLRFGISLKETFSNAITFTVINKYGKGPAVHIATVFQNICYVVCPRVL